MAVGYVPENQIANSRMMKAAKSTSDTDNAAVLNWIKGALQQGANPNYRDSLTGETFTYYLVANNRYAVLSEILKMARDTELREDRKGMIWLDISVKSLPSRRDDGRDALMKAVDCGNRAECTQLLGSHVIFLYKSGKLDYEKASKLVVGALEFASKKYLFGPDSRLHEEHLKNIEILIYTLTALAEDHIRQRNALPLADQLLVALFDPVINMFERSSRWAVPTALRAMRTAIGAKFNYEPELAGKVEEQVKFMLYGGQKERLRRR